MSRRWGWMALLAVVALVATAPLASAQATTGRISGVVKDTSGGVLPGVTVTATETRTGFNRNGVTDANGVYTFVNLPLGDYTVAAELEGFKKASKAGFVLVADGRIGVDFALEVGSFTETVVVTTTSETVNTISGEVSRTIDRGQVQDLALNGRNYMQLATLVPGAPIVNMNALDIMTGLGISTTINGSRQNASLLTVDGGMNMDAGSNNSQISNVGIDFIEQVSVKTSNFSAEYGRNSGAAINVVTRSGTNSLKGSAFEYMRRDAWDTNDWFNQKRGVAKAPLTYDNPGFSLGGPIAKDKIFFFGGMEWKRIRRVAGPNTRTLPTSAMRNGDFSALTSLKLIDPLTKQQFPGNVIPANRITPDGRAIANVYGQMAQAAAKYDDGVLTNNAVFQDDNPFDFRQEMLRIDYQPSGAHRLTGRMVLDHYNLIAPYGTFIDSQLPTIPTNRKRPGRNIQVNHYWTLRNNLVNEAKFNYSGNGQIIPPVGDAWKRSTYGFQFPQLYNGGGNYDDSIPNVDMQSYATFRGANGFLMSPTWDYSFSDNLTWIKGEHTIKSGFLGLYNTKDQNGRSNYPGALNFSTSGNPNTTGNAFADALLGNFRSYSEAQLDPVGYFRYWQFEAFVSDAWRINDRLSVEAGVRYMWQMPTITLGNNTTSFDPALYNPSQAVTLKTNGTIDTAQGGNRYNGLTRPGDVPSSQVGNVPNASNPAVLAIPVASSRGYYQSQNLWAPRASFAYNVTGDGKTSLRGGAGLFYDRPEGNLYFSLVNNPPFSLSSSYENGNLANPAGGTAAAVAPWASMDSLDPNLKIPRVWNWSLGVQHELPFWGLFGEVTYVGNKGQQLLRQPDINQPSFDQLAANQAGPKYNTNYLRPYKGFSNIRMRLSDVTSSYNSLQLFLSRRRGNLNFTVNYTYGKAYDYGSGNGDAMDTGADWRDLSTNYGPSNENRPHIFVTTFTYRLPFWLNRQDIVGSLLGGWEISGITRYQSGSPYSASGATSIGTRRGDFAGGSEKTSNAGDLLANNSVAWLDTTKFSAAPESRLGNITRNMFVGPSYKVWDLSLRKQFRVKGSVKAAFQADFFNAFNQLDLGNPATTITNSGFGLINSAQPMRNVQLGFRVTF